MTFLSTHNEITGKTITKAGCPWAARPSCMNYLYLILTSQHSLCYISHQNAHISNSLAPIAIHVTYEVKYELSMDGFSNKQQHNISNPDYERLRQGLRKRRMCYFVPILTKELACNLMPPVEPLLPHYTLFPWIEDNFSLDWLSCNTKCEYTGLAIIHNLDYPDCVSLSPICLYQEDISCLMTEFQTQRRKVEEQICKTAYNKSRITVGDLSLTPDRQPRLTCLIVNDFWFKNERLHPAALTARERCNLENAL